ncbi:MAG: 50S ribosomal protein L3 [Kiritimatiellae bacterium]|nr:50S ribosomal protein L3 [Kiritimatiellia bacterium]
MEGLIGKKIGMTQVYDADGNRTCVTVIEVGPCPVVQLKTLEKDGYVAAQVGFWPQKKQRLAKAQQKHFEKAGVETMRVLKEFALDDGETLEVGKAVTVANFDGVKYVDVAGMTKGKGFAGVLKKWGFAGGNMTHGGHSKRRTGGLAARDLPGWIEKGKKMPGDMGDVRRKVTNLEVVQIRPEDNAILVKGSIPGARNGIVIVSKSLKNNVIAAKKGGK